MDSWYFYSIFATICFGIASAVHKIPAARGQNFFVASVWSVVVPFVLSLIFFWKSIFHASGALLLISAGWALFFSISRYLYFEIFRHADLNFVTPFTATIQLILTTIVGLLFFQDKISFHQGIGIVLAIAITLAFIKKKAGFSYSPLVARFILVVTVSSIAYKIFQKMGSTGYDLGAFIIYQFAFASLFLILLFIIAHRNEVGLWRGHLSGSGAKVGVFMGIMSFTGGYAYNYALSVGPFSLVNGINSLYILVTIAMGYFLYKEELTLKKILLILLAIVAIILIRLD